MLGFGCGEVGHFRRDCPRKNNLDSSEPTHKVKTAEANWSDSDSDGVFAATDSVGSPQMGQ